VVDWFVLLTPLLVIVVIALLGFTGCDLVFPLDPPDTLLTLKLRVPSQLTVVQTEMQFTQPGSTTPTTVTEFDRSDDGPDIVVLSHKISKPATGSWEVGCRITVKDPTGPQATDFVIGSFTLDFASENKDAAIFETSGRPANNDFRVLFTGLVPDE
jgi:hypothetical protein